MTTSAARMSAKDKRAAVVRARLDGHQWDKCAEIAGYSNATAAHRAFRQYCKETPVEDVEERRDIERQRLEDLMVEARAILARQHVVVNNKGIVGRYTGKIQRDETGEFMYVEDASGVYRPVYVFEPLQDDEPALRAINTIRQLSESIRKLLGLDMPVRIEIDKGEVDEEIVALVKEMQEMGVPAVPGGHEG